MGDVQISLTFDSMDKIVKKLMLPFFHTRIFRPVTVLPALSKIFQHLIHQQLTVHLEKILHDAMFGYRNYYNGCLTALTEQWKEDLDNHDQISTVAIDLSKAFAGFLRSLKKS